MNLRGWVTSLLIGAGGLVAAAVAAVVGGVSTHDTVYVLVESVVGAGGVVLVSACVLTIGRRARLGIQIAIAALAPVVAVAVGIVWATSSMFLEAHDTSVLVVVLFSAGTVGMVSAVLLGRRVAVASRSVGQLARSLGETGPHLGTPGAGLGAAEAREGGSERPPGELAALADELHATSERLAKAQKEATDSDQARRDLVAWVSHDLRTPLSGIRLMAEALEDNLVDDPEVAVRYYATIRAETDRLAAMVDDLFELSRIQSGNISLAFGAASLQILVGEAVHAAAPAAKAKRIDLRHVRPDDRIPVKIDIAAMTRVVRNLVDNAIRHTPTGGTVTVATKLAAGPDAAPELTVSDACGGIPPVDLERVFVAGYRGDLARTPGHAGGGFGLAIAAGLVKAHAGEITVVNTASGCRFTVRLPPVGFAEADDESNGARPGETTKAEHPRERRARSTPSATT